MESIKNYQYLNKQHLKGFNPYKYSAIDTSPLSNYVMHPLWNASVKVLPKWLAPNVLTFAGFLLMVELVVLLGIYDYSCYGPIGKDGGEAVPSWVFTACAVFLFVAYNLDGMDGKQARRIGVSGPLGEMFDHGLDSYVVFFIPYSLLNIFGRNHEFTISEFRAFLTVVSVCLNFYVSHVEKYNTGTLYLPWGYDVSMWSSSLLFLLPGLYGPSVYRFYMSTMFGEISFVKALEIIVHATGLLTTLPIAVHHIYLARKLRTNLQKSLMATLRPIWLMMAMTVTMVAWAAYSPGNILAYDPKAFIFLYGTLFSNISSRLIVAEMSKQKCDVITWMIFPLLASVAVSFCVPQLEVPAMYAVLVVCLLGHIHYGVRVVQQLCGHFRTNCFTVPTNKRK